jgi:hypothetical protein
LLARLFAAARLYVNFFQPSFKLREKRREGAKVIKRYDAPCTPYHRALAHPAADRSVKRKLRQIYRDLDPVALLAEIRAAQAELGNRVDRRPGSAIQAVPERTTLANFAERLGTNWQSGERRAIHRHPYVRRKPWPRRPSMLDPVVSRLEAWLAAEPHLSAVAILDRLSGSMPGSFGPKQRRTLQRFVQAWRAKAARLLIDGAEAMITTAMPAAVPAGTAAGEHTSSANAALGNIVS